jgi:mono/diheme cytochrome c family protein
MGKFLLFILCFLCFEVVFYPGAAAASDPFEGGERLYKEKCVICHGLKGNGEGPAGAAFSPHPTDFTKPQFWQKKDIDRFIAETVKKGHSPMPAFDLAPEEIRAIIGYMSHAFKPTSK